MNIFFLDLQPDRAAKFHCDKHVVKMILESGQILSTVADYHQARKHWMPWPCYWNHPCVKWAGKSRENARWLSALGFHLCIEYRIRYNKVHKYENFFWHFINEGFDFLPDLGLTPPALAMPDNCKIGGPVSSYREYYRRHKQHIAKWKTSRPYWYY